MMIITIDGPTASGKSTVARLLAQNLGFMYLNTGLLYRAVAYMLHERMGCVFDSMSPLTAQDLRFIQLITYGYHEGKAHIAYDGEEITEYLYDAVLDQVASLVSAHPDIRAVLLYIQRDIAKTHDLVADGRDCGTVVFPEAAYKFYLEASLAERARRIMQDEARANRYATIQEAKAAVRERDERDMTRAVAPLRVPEGAVVIDTTCLEINDIVAKILTHIHIT